MGKTRDLFKELRVTKGEFHAKMGTIKDRNSMDLKEAEDTKKRWQEYTVVIYGCERWNIKKAEHRSVDSFGLWCWRRLLRVPSTARRSNQSILKETSAGCSLEGLMLKLNFSTLAT